MKEIALKGHSEVLLEEEELGKVKRLRFVKEKPRIIEFIRGSSFYSPE
jgi:hypothetical protein